MLLSIVRAGREFPFACMNGLILVIAVVNGVR